MTPTLHFDMKLCDQAVEAYTSIADECPNIVKNAAYAHAALTEEIGRFSKLIAPTNSFANMVAERKTALEAILSLCPAAKATDKIADSLSKALSELRKHPYDKKMMETFVACLKQAQASCQLLRTGVGKFNGEYLQAFGGGETRKQSFLLYVQKLQHVLVRDAGFIKPPRPLQGPPPKH